MTGQHWFQNMRALKLDEGMKIFIFSLPLFLFLLGYSVPTYFVLKKTSIAIIEFIFSILAIGSYPLYKFTRSYAIAGNYLISIGITVVVGLTILTGGVYGPSGFWFAIFPLMSSIVLGKKYARYWAGLTFILMLVIHLNQETIENFSFAITDKTYIDQARIRTLYALFFFVLVMSLIYEKFMTYAYRQTREDREKIQSLLRLVTHDISNYLVVAKSSAHILQKKRDLPEDKRDMFFEKLENGLSSIWDLLEQVRKIEAMKSGKINLSIEPVKIHSILQKSIKVFEEKLREKKLSIKLECQNEDLMVLADALSLEIQVINNIISNAIKFSSQNRSISIKIEEKTDVVAVTFTDQGIGMNQAMLANVFSETGQYSRKGTSGERGTGFGMPLLKKFMDVFEGKISINSRCISEHPDDHGTEIELIFKSASKKSSDT